ncbi:MAG: hypothetical protein KGM24_12915 [Elusimicrobia bacterium]|nr:hypothetical protein [Elusimicrobiota bacterium]
MIRPDVVEYLRENLPKFPIDALRRQLYEEGVSDIDFEACLEEAQRVPTAAEKKKTAAAKAPAASNKKAKLLAGLGAALIGGVLLYALSQNEPASAPKKAAPAPTGVSSYVSPRGWVVRLPQNYVAVAAYKDDAKTVEVVHFCPRGTDPTNFLDPGLFGPLEIVRVEVERSPFPSNPTGLSEMAQTVEQRATARGEKYAMKMIHIATLPGVQLNILAPFPRVEAYVLGQRDLYFFYGGQEDDVWRGIVQSLRDAHSEN